MLQARRWLPGREPVLVGDSSFAALDLLAALSGRGVACITRLRLDAALYESAPLRKPGTGGRPRKTGARLPSLCDVLAKPSTAWQRTIVPRWYGNGPCLIDWYTDSTLWRHRGLPVVPTRWVLLRDPQRRFNTQALLCTDPAQEPLQIVGWFMQRWQIEVTFQEARAHLGLETQRQWSDRAITRTTPCLLALFSMVTLLAASLSRHAQLPVASDAFGTAKPIHSSATHWPPCEATSGANRVLSCPPGQARR